MDLRLTLSCAASIAALTWTSGALAQDAEPQMRGAGQDLISSDIIVTAQKREQRLIDVPMAVAVLSGEELKQRGVETIQDLSLAVPGLSMREDGPGSYTIFLRGLANQSGNGALVSVYLDEAPLSLDGFNQLSPVALDIERIEVLKGPQGTLYGQGSAGGTIRYITGSPKLDRVEGRIEGEIYTVDEGSVGAKGTALLNVPLVNDVLGLRVAGSYEGGGGWIDQPPAGIKNGNGTKLLNLRGKLLFAPGDAFSAEAMVQVHRADTRLGLGYEEPDRTALVAIDPATVLIPKEFDFTLYNLELRYDFGGAEIVSATTYIDHDHKYPFSYTSRGGNVFAPFGLGGNDARSLKADQLSQELRLASTGEGAFDWTLGVFYRDVETSSVVVYDSIYDGFISRDLYYGSDSTSKSYSLFADVAYDLTDRLTVGAGVRYFHDKQTSLIEYAPGTGNVQEAKFDSVDPRLYVSYKYADKANLYASAAKGFRSGGFNVEPFPGYDPEKIYTYEIGTKGSSADGVLQFEVAAFYTDYKDMVRRRLVPDGVGVRSESSNIGRIEVKGIELGFAYRPTPPLTLSATGAYLHSEITETDATDPVNDPGDRTDYTPRLSFTLSGNYEIQWGSDVPGFIRLDYSHRDAVTYIDRGSFIASSLPQRSDALDLFNARIGATFGGLTLEAYALNLTNQNKSIDPYQGWANANRTRPRVIGLRAGYTF